MIINFFGDASLRHPRGDDNGRHTHAILGKVEAGGIQSRTGLIVGSRRSAWSNVIVEAAVLIICDNEQAARPDRRLTKQVVYSGRQTVAGGQTVSRMLRRPSLISVTYHVAVGRLDESVSE